MIMFENEEELRKENEEEKEQLFHFGRNSQKTDKSYKTYRNFVTNKGKIEYEYIFEISKDSRIM